MLITAIHLSEQKQHKVTYKNHPYQNKKQLFSKAANTKGIRFCSINKSALLVAAYWHRCMHRRYQDKIDPIIYEPEYFVNINCQI